MKAPSGIRAMISSLKKYLLGGIKDAFATCRENTRESTSTIRQRAFCLGCADADAMECMRKVLRPGYHDDFIDVGAPRKCVCACHKDEDYE